MIQKTYRLDSIDDIGKIAGDGRSRDAQEDPG